MRIAIAMVFLLLTGCAVNGYAKYYNAQPGSETIAASPYYEKAPPTPRIYAHSDDVKADAKRLAEDGYVLIGTASFFGPPKIGTRDEAIEQGQKIGASLILIHSKYRDTLTGTVPYTVPTAPQVATVNTNGTANVYGNGGYATGNYNSTSTVTMPGGSTTYNIPYAVTRNDYFASFWAARDPRKMRLGVNYVPLPDEVRTRLQRNTGLYVPIVVRGTPAFNANILEGDVIVSLNGTGVLDAKVSQTR